MLLSRVDGVKGGRCMGTTYCSIDGLCNSRMFFGCKMSAYLAHGIENRV